MKPGIHPLQSAGYDLMKQLYTELSLPMTNAMITAQRHYYPSIESIFKTLDHYSDQELVIEFRNNNETLISDALEEMSAEKNESSINSDTFGEIFNRMTVAEVIKSLSIDDIEKTLSESLSQRTDEVLDVSINQIRNCDNYSSEVDIYLKVTAGEKKS